MRNISTGYSEWSGLGKTHSPPTTKASTPAGLISQRCRECLLICISASSMPKPAAPTLQRCSTQAVECGQRESGLIVTHESPAHTVDELAEFVVGADQADLSGNVRATLK